MLKHLRRASVLRFPRQRTLNPKTLNHPKPKTPSPKTLNTKTEALKTLNPKLENTAYTQYFLQSLLSYIRQHDILMSMSGQHTASVGIIILSYCILYYII